MAIFLGIYPVFRQTHLENFLFPGGKTHPRIAILKGRASDSEMRFEDRHQGMGVLKQGYPQKLLFWGSTILRNQMSMFFMFFVRGCWRPQELYIGYQLRLQRVKEAQLQNVLRTLTTVANVIEPAIQFKSSNSVSLRGSSFEIHRVLDILWACATSCPGQITEWPG